MVRRVGLVSLILLALAVLGGCHPPAQRLSLRGGPSLNGLFAELAQSYQAAHPDALVAADFTCPPCIMLQQPGRQATFDVFAALGDYELERLETQSHLRFTERRTIGATCLALVTSSRSTAPVRSMADLHRREVRHLGVGDPEQTSVGYYTRQALRQAGLWDEVKPQLVYARSGCELLKWLSLGRQLDAAFVFGICTREVPGSLRTVTLLPSEVCPKVSVVLAVSAGCCHPEQARRFLDFAASPQAAPLLARYLVTPAASAAPHAHD